MEGNSRSTGGLPGGTMAKYLLVGGGTALLELALFQGLLLLTSNIPISNATAVLVATVANFLLNRNVTFRSTTNYFRSIALYAALYLANMCFSTAAIQVISSFGAPALAVKLCTMACIVCWNYVIYRKVIFV